MTEKKVKDILSKQLGVGVDKINANTDIATDLGADSLDLVELVLDAETEYGVTFTNDELTSFKTVKDVMDALDQKQ